MHENAQPLVMLYGYSDKKNELSFVGRKGIITIAGATAQIKRILRLCNGLTSVRDIVGQFPFVHAKEIAELLNLCESQGVVKDSRELYLEFHSDSSNPPAFSQDMGASDVESFKFTERLRERDGLIVRLPQPSNTQLLDIIHRRESVREFQPGQVTLEKLSGVFNAMYGLGDGGHWSVPSGGGLYPLDLYLVIPDDGQPLSRGVYRWNPEKCVLTTVESQDPRLWVSKVFNTNALLTNATGILCVGANLRRTTAKYANRGYRYALIEAGHVAQNAYLYCAEQGLGLVEYGGFNDDVLGRELGLRPFHEAIMTTLIMGVPDRRGKKTYTSDRAMTEVARHLRKTLVGPGKPIANLSLLEPSISNYAMPNWAAVASYRATGEEVSKKAYLAFATGSTSDEAVVKVLAEGFERYALRQSRSDMVECADRLEGSFLDPRDAVPFSPFQYDLLKDIKPFDPREKIDWVTGVREQAGERVWVPSDLIFLRDKAFLKRQKVYYKANSSGVAAHLNRQLAVETALYELIERDAFCATWYSKREVKAISPEYFSDSLKDRISRWKNFGYTVTLLDLTLDGPPVALAIIWSPTKRPALCAGAGCRTTLDEAIIRAFNEAEFMAMTWQGRKVKRKIKPNEVRSADDHGVFYMDPQNLVHAEWLLKAEIGDVTTKNFTGDFFKFDPIVVDITPKDNSSGLVVVRVMSKKLLPMNFGYGSEHYGHRRMDVLGLRWQKQYPAIPHFFP